MNDFLGDSTLDHLRQIVHDDIPNNSRYCIRESIGQGGMGTVYLADDIALRRPVAMKVLRDGAADADAIDRMLREAHVVARLEHPGIVPVHDVGCLPDGRVYYIMKLVKGRRLDEYADASASLRERLRLFERICETVAFAHAHGVIHRDLKPQNVMVGQFGEVLVLDWGLAKVVCEATHGAPLDGTALPLMCSAKECLTETVAPQTAHGTVLGTPAYMSPEQARGEVARVDERSDVFALGGILYFLLTGQAPFAAVRMGDGADEPAIVPPRQRNRAVPRRLQSICLKSLFTDSEQRYVSAAEFASDVARFQNGQAVIAHREGLPERIARWVWWYRAPILIIAAYLLMRGLLMLWQRR
ncbi:MAG: serine/threonine protein kinase [Planctomycetes bacterium]|nr:serine/threonine protein kinase [Planctomycetota bacterium]MBI3833116.1 serine/threonine protein kinase [Planctomycetota bacterium]